ncbi:MAG: tRNA(Met) cytidine acetate ligase, partial [Bacilli bacterium]
MTKIVGIIVEHNPFHNGHYYHILETKKAHPDALIVACMSGHFLQRGEPAIVHPHLRTKWLLAHGIDLIVELPYAFATARADVFATGAIKIFAALGVNTVVFGSETNNLARLHTIAQEKITKKQVLDTIIQKKMHQGARYKTAYSNAVDTIINDDQTELQPNDILGLAYIEAAKKFAPNICFQSIKRQHNHYGDTSLPADETKFASATSIRYALQNNDWNSINQFVPASVFSALKENASYFGHWERLYPYLRYRALTVSSCIAENTYEMSEGLENRIIETAKNNLHFNTYMQALKTKRYSYNRLQRASLHLLTGASKAYMQSQQSQPISIRLLGANVHGTKLLKGVDNVFATNKAWYAHDPFQQQLEQL